MRLYFGGAEVPGWRNLLAEERVPAVSLSFVGLARRVKGLENWLLADKFPADPGFSQEIFLDSGAYSLNKSHLDPSKEGYTDEQAQELFDAYLVFVQANLDRIEFFSEFDAMQLGPEWLGTMRDNLSRVGGEKFMPIWREGDGEAALEYLAEAYPRVGVLQMDDQTAKDLSPMLRRVAESTKLHGVAMTHMASMKGLPWDSVGSTSWLAPGQWGETHIWLDKSRTLKRYPVKYKEKSRKDHRNDITGAGFDSVAIARDATDAGTSEDRREVLRLSVWSWGKFVDSINREPDDEPRRRGAPRTAAVAIPEAREKKLLPVLSLHEAASDNPDGDEITEERVGASTANLMRCNTCFVRDKCPEFKADAECAFEIPMVVSTTTQARALRKWALSLQAQRVATMRMFEQLEGGYADPNLSAELTRLSKMLKEDHDAERQGGSVEIKVNGDQNFMAAMFGAGVEEKVNALPQPVDAPRMLEDVFEGEVVDD